ncbi:MAG: NAD(P)H-hydrate epimerase, partial [Planctomycetota bacterium]
ITIANSIQGNRIAIDIPTGIDAETGEHSDCYFEADLTLTFVARKPAMPVENTRHLFGEIEVLPIGTPSGLNSQILADQ